MSASSTNKSNTTATTNNKPQSASQAGDSINNPIKLTSKVDVKSFKDDNANLYSENNEYGFNYDTIGDTENEDGLKYMPLKVKYRKGIKISDVGEYVAANKYLHIFADGIEINGNIRYIADAKRKYNNNLPSMGTLSFETTPLKVGNRFGVSMGADENLKPNSWYEWVNNRGYLLDTISRELQIPHEQLPSDITSRVKSNLIDNDSIYYRTFMKTDKDGNALSIRIKKQHDNTAEEDFSVAYSTPEIPIIIVDSNDKDGIDVPVIPIKNNEINTTPSAIKPDDKTPQSNTSSDDTNTTPEVNDVNSDNVNTVPEINDITNSVQPVDTNKEKINTDKTNISANDKKSTKKELIQENPKTQMMFTHNAFVYNKHGKLARVHRREYVLLRKNKYFTALDNGKIYTIKGKKFYRIGKNRYIKVANTGVRPKAKSINKTATLKGKKRIHLYNGEGKITKKFAPKHMTFDMQRTINGKKLYRIKGTNSWISAKKVSLKK